MDMLPDATKTRFHEWLQERFDLEFNLHITKELPCDFLNEHPFGEDFHVEGMCKWDGYPHDVYVWQRASDALKAFAHECVELTWIREGKRHNPNSGLGYLEEELIEREAKRLVKEFLQREVYTDIDSD